MATTFFKSTVGPAILHLTCDEFAVVKFNGVKIFDHTEFNNYNRPTHLMYQVPVAEGYNQLSIYYEVDSNPLIGAKLLNLDGSYRAVRELPSDSSLPAIPHRPNFKPVRTPVFATIESQSPFDAIRNVHLLALENRAAEALAIAEPEEMDLHQTLAWLNARWFALASSNHFSSSIVRRMQRELFERISSNGYYLYVPFTDELYRLLSEDQIETALEACDLWLVDLPRRPDLIEAQIECLSHFDPSLSLAKKELEQLLIDAPYRSYAYDKLIKLAEQQQNYQYKLELLERSVQFTGSNSSSLIRFLLQGDSAQVDRGLAMIDRILDEHPNSPLAESLLASHYSKTDDLRTKAEFTAELAQRHPHDFNLQLDLLSSYYSMDKLDDAIAVLDSLSERSPSSPEVIKWQRLLHNSTIYDSFFSDFAPDSEAVLANRDINTGDAQFPTSSLLDSALRFVFADNGYITRSHTITRINNAQGALDYGTQEVSGNPIHMRVIKANGDIFEAHQVDGTWVLPTLEQGDVIDSKNEHHFWGSPGIPTISGTTTFQFFNLPKKSVSAVYYIDDQANGEIRSFNTSFEPEIHDYATGKVHVYERQDAAALIPEAFMPSPDSFVPGVQYGFDVSLENSANRLFFFMKRLTDCPADIELQLQAWLEQLNPQGNQHQRANEIYWAVQDYIINFESFNDIIDTFTLKEGRPIGLLSKLFELNGISHEWAFVASAAPHLDNSQPVFDEGDKFQYPVLRLPPTVAGEQPLWVFSLEHNAPIGMGHPGFYGADVLVLGRDFHRLEKFEPHPANEIRNPLLHQCRW
ncbi:MAG: hypothetical protein QGF46_02395 [Planctomycetota bacterium]|nr:hypothetical protein [Planctomycetota bacterium]